MRVGIGYDIHQLVEGRDLFLGGIQIPFDKGLAGHSDADVLVHAVCDAILGAAGLGDMGRHFPDSDPAFKGIRSTVLLQRTADMIKGEGYRVHNVDVTVLAEAPKLKPFAADMCKALAGILEVTPNQINIKATTHEGLGDIGRGAAMAAQCVVLIE
jgi:2-C-methyl-D-erythritol 2,4-cyclodiphosphate synthase